MPARQKRYDDALKFAPWVNDLENTCLKETVKEALLSRQTATQMRADERAIAAGDKILERIEFRKYDGDVACRQAATAVRRFDEAYMSAYHKKHGQALAPGRKNRLATRYGRAVAAMTYAVGDTVTLLKGHRIGMGRLREEVRARITQIQTANDGSPFYGLEWTDPRTGKRRTTWWAP